MIQDIKKLIDTRKGTMAVKRIYLGSELVWDSEPWIIVEGTKLIMIGAYTQNQNGQILSVT